MKQATVAYSRPHDFSDERSVHQLDSDFASSPIQKMDSTAFFSYNRTHGDIVEEVARRLVDSEINVWFDKWSLVPGEPWQPAAEKAIRTSSAVVVFIGDGGLGPWQYEEIQFAIERRVTSSSLRVVPVLLPSVEFPDVSKLPGFLASTTWVEFRSSIEDPDALNQLVCGIRGTAPDPRRRPGTAPKSCPFRGLEPFREQHQDFFFGREAKLQLVKESIRPKVESDIENRFLAIIGSSGSGKSSLINAGLIPQLKNNLFPDSSRWPILSFRPGAKPIESLASVLAANPSCGNHTISTKNILAKGDQTFLDVLTHNQNCLHLTIENTVHQHGLHRVVMIIDQFEELFTLCKSPEQQHAFVKNLLYATGVTQGHLLLLVSMRSDFFPHVLEIPELARAISRHQEVVMALNEQELRQAIEKPPLLAGRHVEPGLADVLIEELKGQKGMLPLLQYCLSEIWAESSGDQLSIESYRKIGGIRQALRVRADSIYKQFTEQEKMSCRRLFLRLTSPGDGTEVTKRRIRAADLANDETMGLVAKKLIESRLLTTSIDESDANHRTIELAHEALIHGWPKLQDWLDDHREAHIVQHRLIHQTNLWQENDCDQSYLYHGHQLQNVEQLVERQAITLSENEQQFLAASREFEPFEHDELSQLIGMAKLDKQDLVVSTTKSLREIFPNASFTGYRFFAALEKAGYVSTLNDDQNPVIAAKKNSQKATKTIESTGKHFRIDVNPLKDGNLGIVVREVTDEVMIIRRFETLYEQREGILDLRPEEISQMAVDERVDLLKDNIVHYANEGLPELIAISVMLLDNESNLLEPLLTVGLEATVASRRVKAVASDGVNGFVCATGQSYLCQDTTNDPLYLDFDPQQTPRSSITAPLLLANDTTIGVISLEREGVNALSEEDLRFLQYFSADIATAINTLELLVASSADSLASGVAQIRTSLSLPIDEILNDTVNVLERYIGHDPESTARLRNVLENARMIKSMVSTVGSALPEFEQYSEPQVDKSLLGKRILVADADMEVRQSAHLLLEKYGAVVETACDANEAMLMIRNTAEEIRYDAALIDVRIPGIPITTLVMQLDYPIERMVIMTGFGYDPGHQIVKLRNMGLPSGSVIFKPFRLDQLLTMLRSIIDDEDDNEDDNEDDDEDDPNGAPVPVG